MLQTAIGEAAVRQFLQLRTDEVYRCLPDVHTLIVERAGAASTPSCCHGVPKIIIEMFSGLVAAELAGLAEQRRVAHPPHLAVIALNVALFNLRNLLFGKTRSSQVSLFDNVMPGIAESSDGWAHPCGNFVCARRGSPGNVVGFRLRRPMTLADPEVSRNPIVRSLFHPNPLPDTQL